MTFLRVSIVAVLVALGATGAHCQMLQYGAPQPLEFPQMQPASYGVPVAAQQPAGSSVYGGPQAYVPMGPQAGQAQYSQPQYQQAQYPQPQYYQAANGPARGPMAPQAVPNRPLPPAPGAPIPAPSQEPIAAPVMTPQPEMGPGPSLVNEMMVAPGVQPGAGGVGNYGGYGGCGTSAGCGVPSCAEDCDISCPWYFSAYALYMTRDKSNMVWTTAENATPENQWGYNEWDWKPGGEVRIGRMFCCNEYAVEARFWALDEFNTCGQVGDGGTTLYNTPMTMRWVDMLGTTDASGAQPTNASEWFDASPLHRVQRSAQVYNVEINLLRNRLCGQPCDGVTIDVLFGVRFFRFRDRLNFTAQHGEYDSAGDPGSPYEGDWIHLDDEVTNNLLGGQLGFNLNYNVGQRFKVFVSPTFGLFNNQANLDYNLYGTDGAGAYYQGSSPSYQPLDYPIRRTQNNVAFLTQVDLGASWAFAQRWEATVGYRLLACTGMALTDNQVPFYGNDTLAIADIKTNGHLLLHGAFAGLTFRF